MAWIKVEQSIRDHRKIFQVADDLDVEAAHVTGCLVLFWLWAIDNAPEGSLAGIKARTIARAAQWDGDEAEFVEALTRAGLLEETPEGLAIHDWAERAGNLIDRRKSDAERKRRERADKKNKEDPAEASEGRPPDVRTQSRAEQTRAEKSRADQSRAGEKAPKAPGGDDSAQPAAPSLQDQRFSEFWAIYPKKVGKADALKAWKRAKITEETYEKILKAVELWKTSAEWAKENGRFIPNPSTWINQGRWDDELPEPAPAKNYAKGFRTDEEAPPGKSGTLGVLARMYAEEDDGQIPGSAPHYTE